MSRWKLRIDARAEAEARAAYLWYLARNPQAAERFRLAVEECIEAITDAPERFPLWSLGVRRSLVLHRFPYAVVYRIVGEEIQVVAVMHQRRRPGYWGR